MNARPNPSAGTLAASIFAPLAQLRRRWRAYLAIDGLVQLALALVGAGLLQLLLDRWLRFSVDQRAFLNSIITIFWLVVVYRYLVTRLLRPIDDDFLAAAVDQANPLLFDQVSTAVQFATGRTGAEDTNSPALMRAVMADAGHAAEGVRFVDVLDHARARRRAALLGGLLLIIVGAFTLPGVRGLMSTWFQRNWLLADLDWPQRTHIFPEGYDTGVRRAPLGDELEIEARVEGEMPTSAELVWRTPSGRHGREGMTLRGGSRLRASLGVLTEDVYFYISGGDDRTRECVAQAVERPQLLRSLARIHPPEYTGLNEVVIEQQTVLEVLRGSTVVIEATASKPIRQAQFVGTFGPLGHCEIVEPTRIRVQLATASPTTQPGASSQPAAAPRESSPGTLESGVFRFELVDRDGWNDRRPLRYTIKIVPDRPPSVSMALVGVGDLVTPKAEPRAELKFDDVYGLASAALVVQKGEDPPEFLEVDGFRPGHRELLATPKLPLAALSAVPGVRMRIWAESADLDPHGPNIGRSSPAELRVVSEEDFLTEMARRELELRREFERLISEQRVLGDALERLVRDLDGPSPPAAAPQQFTALARRQSAQAARCVTLRKQFEQILAEMQTSKVARPGDERRITDRVAEPLGVLAYEAMPAASTAILDYRGRPSLERRETLQFGQADLLRQMRAILANMLEWEGYREAIALLRDIISRQADVRAETLKAMESQLDDILDLDDAAPAKPAGKPPK